MMMDSGYIVLLVIFISSFIGNNLTVAYAAGIVIVLKLLGVTEFMHIFAVHGLKWGIILMTAALLMPIATGDITLKTIIDSFKTPLGLAAIAAGIFTAATAGYGGGLLHGSPEVVAAIVIGTMLGVFFLHGLAVGPLIAAGLTYFIMQLFAVGN
ncbi:DUF441 domain-containing protein [Pectinatus frisingensis]|jgi:uncharacterized membrane protein (DUF441 family)|uniref:DUF441 domain-containing protein n=2 Tax=Pectinatus frisingensis TaxID=865 RepID=UPI001E2C9A8A|nr:DUF441 domain-containing protein [Pectinatus frisingensis]